MKPDIKFYKIFGEVCRIMCFYSWIWYISTVHLSAIIVKELNENGFHYLINAVWFILKQLKFILYNVPYVFDAYFEVDETFANVVVLVINVFVLVVEVFVDINSGFNDVVGFSGRNTTK